jgi:ankyrin repeat protein
MFRGCKLLCEAGADVNVKDRWGNCPLDDAKSAKNATCLKLLEKYGAKYGPKVVSSSMGQEALVDLMHQYGQLRDRE